MLIRSVGADACRVRQKVTFSAKHDNTHFIREGFDTYQIHNTMVQYAAEVSDNVLTFLKTFRDGRKMHSHTCWDIFAELNDQVKPLRSLGGMHYCIDQFRFDDGVLGPLLRAFNARSRLQYDPG